MHEPVCAGASLNSDRDTCQSRLDGNILDAEQEVSDLENTFASPDFYMKPRVEIFDLETQLKTARDKVAHLYARWHELELLQSAPPP
jgi:ABC transporter C-terminal domain